MRLYQDNDGWDGMHDDLLFTESMLLASEEHAALAEALTAHLDAWDALDAERKKAARAVVRGNARVSWANLLLDRSTTYFSGQLLLDCHGDRQNPSYTRFFPEGANKVVRLGLESQLGVMERFPVIAEEVKLPKASAAAFKKVTEQFEGGDQTLKDRKEALLGVVRVAVKIGQWREEANALRRATETALSDYANKNNLPRGYADDFFPAQKKTAGKSDGPPDE